VPIDFPAKTAEGAIRARDRAASEIDAKRIDRRRNGRSVGSRGEIDDRSAPCGWAEEQGDENRDNEENVLHGSPLPSQSPLRGRVGGDYSLLCWSTVRHLAATPTPAANAFSDWYWPPALASPRADLQAIPTATRPPDIATGAGDVSGDAEPPAVTPRPDVRVSAGAGTTVRQPIRRARVDDRE